MAIDFDKLSLKAKGNNKSADASELPRANFWLNIGYEIEVPTEDGKTETRFVSLPQGIALDTQEHVNTKSKNLEWKQFQSARNNLLDQIMEVAQDLEPGDERILNLQIQLRRVNDEDDTIVDVNANPFIAKIGL